MVADELGCEPTDIGKHSTCQRPSNLCRHGPAMQHMSGSLCVQLSRSTPVACLRRLVTVHQSTQCGPVLATHTGVCTSMCCLSCYCHS
jgi:hypothetical protein